MRVPRRGARRRSWIREPRRGRLRWGSRADGGRWRGVRGPARAIRYNQLQDEITRHKELSVTIHPYLRVVRPIRVPLLIGATALLVSCASIIHGTHQDGGISSSPSGASVTIDSATQGTTPFVAKLTRKDNHIVRIELA